MVKRPQTLQGDVWLCALDPTRGAEIQKTRPCLVVSPDALNTGLKTILVVPMTTGGFQAPFRIPAIFQGKDALLLPDQMRAIDRARAIKRLGSVEPSTLSQTLAILRTMFSQ